MKDWFIHNTDKLMLLVLLLVLLVVALHIIHHGDSSAVSWIENIVGQVLAALLTVMVGRTLASRKDDGSNGVQTTNGGTKQ